jgi:hypothetical protein
LNAHQKVLAAAILPARLLEQQVLREEPPPEVQPRAGESLLLALAEQP